MGEQQKMTIEEAIAILDPENTSKRKAVNPHEAKESCFHLQ